MPTYSQRQAQQLFDNLEQVGTLLAQALRKELLEQGHKATGALEKSIEYETTAIANALVLSFKYLRYGQFLETGIPAERIPFSPGSGAKTSQYIAGLMGWIKQRGLETDPKKIKSFAFAIAYAQKRGGYPTPNSKKHSKNGRRTRFQTQTILDNQPEIIKLLQTNIAAGIDALLVDSINQINKELR